MKTFFPLVYNIYIYIYKATLAQFTPKNVFEAALEGIYSIKFSSRHSNSSLIPAWHASFSSQKKIDNLKRGHFSAGDFFFADDEHLPPFHFGFRIRPRTYYDARWSSERNL